MKQFPLIALIALAILNENCSGSTHTNRETVVAPSQNNPSNPDGGTNVDEQSPVIVSRRTGCDGGITCVIVLVPGDPAWMQPPSSGH